MKHTSQFCLLICAGFVLTPGPRVLLAQACKDEEFMATENRKSLIEVVETVRKESLGDFQKGYHQKSVLNKLTFCVSAVNGLLACLEKAEQDTTAEKEDVDAAKAKHEAFSKLKDKIDADRKALKDAADAKDAKALVEKFDFSK